MSLRKLRIGMFVALFIGMCVLPVAAIKITDINYLLVSPGGYKRTSDFYAQRYDVLYIELESDGVINIQMRESDGTAIAVWNDLEGLIDVHYVVPKDASYYMYFENADGNDTLVTGVLYLNEDVVVTTTTITTTTSIIPIDPGFVITLLTVIYGIAGALFVVSIFVYRRRKNPNFKFLSWFDDDELLPPGWQPDEEEEET